MDYYKVVNHIDREAIIDTYSTNYSLILSKSNNYADLLDFIVSSSEELEIPLDFYFTLNNGLSLFGEMYLKNFSQHNNGLISYSKEVYAQRNFPIRVEDFVLIIQSLIKIGIQLFNEGFYLWEYIYELVRKEYCPNKPKRADSFFLFDSVNDCIYYRDKIKGGGEICKVEIINERKLFKGDMNLLDLIPNNITTKEAKNQTLKYWNGESSTIPVYEYLLEGECRLIPIK
ncbi:MAG: DUF2441 domain-containing protein [Macellibacteroides sp.]|uniref:DUF2441 domain-containing protein n=1 Tax=Macellibacteroides sp. TaxID=2014584 RepID=UPI003E77C638